MSECNSAGRVSRCQRDCRRFESGHSLHFFWLFPETVSNPRKKQAMALANEICPPLLFLFALVIFCNRKKWGLLTVVPVAFAALRLAAGFALASNPA